MGYFREARDTSDSYDFRSKNESHLESFTITNGAFSELVSSVGQQTPETGGPLFGSRNDYVVQKFVYDQWGSRSYASYDPDIAKMNQIVKQIWEQEGLALIGWAHSHPRGIDRLSGPDLAYIEKFFSYIPALTKFLAPIIHSSHDGQLVVYPFIAYPGKVGDYQMGSLKLVPKHLPQGDHSNSIFESPKEKSTRPFFKPSTLERKVGSAVDAKSLKKTKVFAVGSGGANGIYENLIRLGIGHITVLDFDEVDASNLVTQGWFADQIGIKKVEALKQTVARLIPDPAKINTRLTCLDDDFLALDDSKLVELAAEADLLLFMTDNFYAQARGNRLALKLQKPAIFAMMYERAHCSEITFTIPGVTPACHRCALSSRYDAYLNSGYKNTVGSDGSLIFQTQALNSSIGLLALAILHRDKPGFEFGGWFGKKWERNLLQTRINPKYKSPLFEKTFGSIPHIFCFDTIWQKIEPECPPKYAACPDCGGIGDLRKANIGQTKL